MLEPEALRQLKEKRNLLAFSAGVDSTALYHLLKEKKIPFDIALVNYKTRPQSDEEARYAEELVQRDGKKIFILTRPLDPGEKAFEARARKIRYDFFNEIVAKEGYDNLVTAHQLDDMLEWSLMQLCRGCGTAEFVGMQPVEERKSYTLVRPLLFTPRAKLLEYLETNGIRYFIDRSNLDESYRRNLFRHKAAAFLMQECPEGIARSFRYMLEDKKTLLAGMKILFREKEMVVFERPVKDAATIRQIDRFLKKQGYLLSAAQKEEILKSGSVVVGGRWVVEIGSRLVWIAPYVETDTAMPKSFKEACRKARIPKKIRPYLFMTSGLERLLSSPALFSS